jgi:hypothetical protein
LFHFVKWEFTGGTEPPLLSIWQKNTPQSGIFASGSQVFPDHENPE